MPWVKRRLRKNTVYAEVDDNGALQPDADGRVAVLYKLAPDAKVYRAATGNLESTGKDDEVLDFAMPDAKAAATKTNAKKSRTAGNSQPSPSGPPKAGEIHIYTDGACTGNPGPMGIGAVILRGPDDAREELSEFLGRGTNNIAELTAIERALLRLSDTEREYAIHVHTDSAYSLGLLSKGWKAKANQELVARIRKVTKQFPNLHYVKVKGHAGIPENERCDELARDAITDARG